MKYLAKVTYGGKFGEGDAMNHYTGYSIIEAIDGEQAYKALEKHYNNVYSIYYSIKFFNAELNPFLDATEILRSPVEED